MPGGTSIPGPITDRINGPGESGPPMTNWLYATAEPISVVPRLPTPCEQREVSASMINKPETKPPQSRRG